MTKSNNEWVPEVGQECEISNCGNPFEWCLIRYLGEKLIVVDHKPHIDQHYHVGSFVLRKIKTEAEKRLGIQIEDMTDVIFGHLRSDLTADGSRKLARDIIDAGWIKPKPLTAYVIEELADEFYHDKYAFAKAIEAYIRGDLEL